MGRSFGQNDTLVMEAVYLVLDGIITCELKP